MFIFRFNSANIDNKTISTFLRCFLFVYTKQKILFSPFLKISAFFSLNQCDLIDEMELCNFNYIANLCCVHIYSKNGYVLII